MKKRFLIIGASAAGLGCANQLSRLNPEDMVICFSAESELPYNKCFLAGYLAGKRTYEHLFLQKAPGVQLFLNTPIVAIDSDKKYIQSSSGERFSYDYLLIATGSYARVPSISGIEQEGIFTFYSCADALAINRYCIERQVKRALVVGGGVTGIEVADALLSRAIDVEIIEEKDAILSTYACASDQVSGLLKNNGVSIWCNERIQSFEKIADGSFRAHGKSGRNYDADMVIIATGWRPQSALAREAGVAMDGDYVRVDEYMQTSDSSIFVAGDIIQVKDAKGNAVPSILWPDAMIQGIHAAYAMSGGNQKPYKGLRGTVHSDILGSKIILD